MSVDKILVFRRERG